MKKTTVGLWADEQDIVIGVAEDEAFYVVTGSYGEGGFAEDAENVYGGLTANWGCDVWKGPAMGMVLQAFWGWEDGVGYPEGALPTDERVLHYLGA